MISSCTPWHVPCTGTVKHAAAWMCEWTCAWVCAWSAHKRSRMDVCMDVRVGVCMEHTNAAARMCAWMCAWVCAWSAHKRSRTDVCMDVRVGVCMERTQTQLHGCVHGCARGCVHGAHTSAAAWMAEDKHVCSPSTLPPPSASPPPPTPAILSSSPEPMQHAHLGRCRARTTRVATRAPCWLSCSLTLSTVTRLEAPRMGSTTFHSECPNRACASCVLPVPVQQTRRREYQAGKCAMRALCALASQKYQVQSCEAVLCWCLQGKFQCWTCRKKPVSRFVESCTVASLTHENSSSSSSSSNSPQSCPPQSKKARMLQLGEMSSSCIWARTCAPPHA